MSNVTALKPRKHATGEAGTWSGASARKKLNERTSKGRERLGIPRFISTLLLLACNMQYVFFFVAMRAAIAIIDTTRTSETY